MSTTNPKKPRIVIVGAGFGGIYCYLELCKVLNRKSVEITLINKTNHFVFTPLIHEVATGGLSPNLVVESIRKIIKPDTHFYQADVQSINENLKIITTDCAEIPYDYLVLALGSQPRFFNIPGIEHALTLKTLEDAVAMRSTFIDAFETASHIQNVEERRRMLSFVIVGGGATGVEIASEMAEFFHDTFQVYYPQTTSHGEVNIYLVHAEEDILNQFKKDQRNQARRILTKQGVSVITGVRVDRVEPDCVHLSDGSCLSAAHIIWAAGVKPFNLPGTETWERDQFQRIKVNANLQVLDRSPQVFAVGDMASFTPNNSDRPLPMLAQVASRQGKHVAHNIARMINNKAPESFRFSMKGMLVSLGQWQALADIKDVKFSGLLAWFLWRTIYLFKFISASKKLRIAIDWTVNIFYPRDVSKMWFFAKFHINSDSFRYVCITIST